MDGLVTNLALGAGVAPPVQLRVSSCSPVWPGWSLAPFHSHGGVHLGSHLHPERSRFGQRVVVTARDPISRQRLASRRDVQVQTARWLARQAVLNVLAVAAQAVGDPPEEVADAVVSLASSEPQYITGAIFPVDGPMNTPAEHPVQHWAAA